MTVSKFSLLFISCAALVSGLRLSANEPVSPAGDKLTLAAAIAEATGQSPALRVIDAAVDSARGEVQTAGLRPNPELSFAPGLKRVREGDATHHEFKGTFELSRTFLFPGKRELLISIAERNVELRQLGIEGLRFQLSAAVRKVFYELLAAQSIVGLRRQQLESAQTFQEAAARRAEAGYASDFEAVKAQGDVINARKLLQTAENQIAAARVELNGLLGRNPSGPVEVTGALEDTAAPRPMADLIAQALSNPTATARAATSSVHSRWERT